MNGKLQKYASLAEIIGAVGVVVSLIYVGVGVRQNTEALQVANHQALVAMDLEKNAWLRDPAFAATYTQATEDLAPLTPTQLLQLRTFIADAMNAWEFAFITHRRGAMDDNIWTGWDGYNRSLMPTKPFFWFWRENGPTFSPEFSAYVDSTRGS